MKGLSHLLFNSVNCTKYFRCSAFSLDLSPTFVFYLSSLAQRVYEAAAVDMTGSYLVLAYLPLVGICLGTRGGCGGYNHRSEIPLFCRDLADVGLCGVVLACGFATLALLALQLTAMSSTTLSSYLTLLCLLGASESRGRERRNEVSRCGRPDQV